MWQSTVGFDCQGDTFLPTAGTACQVDHIPPQSYKTEKLHIFLWCCFLDSCNHSMEDFAEYLADLENTISTLQPTGRIILAGDLNVHLTQSNQSSSRESLLHHCIHRHNLYSVSTSTNNVSGPNYTFFSSTSHSTVDYILTESSLVWRVISAKNAHFDFHIIFRFWYSFHWDYVYMNKCALIWMVKSLCPNVLSFGW